MIRINLVIVGVLMSNNRTGIGYVEKSEYLDHFIGGNDCRAWVMDGNYWESGVYARKNTFRFRESFNYVSWIACGNNCRTPSWANY